MKKRYGTLVPSGEDENPEQTVGENGHNVNFRALCEIMQARLEEIVRLVLLELPDQKYLDLIPAGIVLTGGCANIPGVVEVTEKLARLPVRIGNPVAITGVSVEALKDPAYATSVGLVLYSMKNKGTSTWFTKRKGFLGFVDQIMNLFK